MHRQGWRTWGNGPRDENDEPKYDRMHFRIGKYRCSVVRADGWMAAAWCRPQDRYVAAEGLKEALVRLESRQGVIFSEGAYNRDMVLERLLDSPQTPQYLVSRVMAREAKMLERYERKFTLMACSEEFDATDSMIRREKAALIRKNQEANVGKPEKREKHSPAWSALPSEERKALLVAAQDYLGAANRQQLRNDIIIAAMADMLPGADSAVHGTDGADLALVPGWGHVWKDVVVILCKSGRISQLV